MPQDIANHPHQHQHQEAQEQPCSHKACADKHKQIVVMGLVDQIRFHRILELIGKVAHDVHLRMPVADIVVVVG